MIDKRGWLFHPLLSIQTPNQRIIKTQPNVLVGPGVNKMPATKPTNHHEAISPFPDVKQHLSVSTIIGEKPKTGSDSDQAVSASAYTTCKTCAPINEICTTAAHESTPFTTPVWRKKEPPNRRPK